VFEFNCIADAIEADAVGVGVAVAVAIAVAVAVADVVVEEGMIERRPGTRGIGAGATDGAERKRVAGVAVGVGPLRKRSKEKNQDLALAQGTPLFDT
jgi:hypothetical protein